MKAAEKEKAISLRKEGKTYREILRVVPVAKSTLSEWLRSVGLSKVQKQKITQKRIDAALRGAKARHATRVKSVENECAIGIEDIGKISPRELFILGVALYWGEGTKQREHSISNGLDFGNMDARMMRVFLAWLRLLHIPEERMRIDLYVHETRKEDVVRFKEWWAQQLSIDTEKIEGVYLKKGSIATKRKNVGDLYHGLLRIKVRASTNLNRRFNGWVEGIVTSVGDGVIGNTSAFEAEDSRIVP